jgi:hypothetical protein
MLGLVEQCIGSGTLLRLGQVADPAQRLVDPRMVLAR